jgi:hypothetical protein
MKEVFVVWWCPLYGGVRCIEVSIVRCVVVSVVFPCTVAI